MNEPVGIEHANAEAAKRIADLEERIRELEAIIETDYVNLIDTVDALEREEEKNKSLRDKILALIDK